MNFIARSLSLTALLGVASVANAQVVLTESTSQTITSGNSVSCNAGGVHRENSYYRSFSLAAFGLSAPFTISDVSFGIELADAGGSNTTQPVDVRIYNTTNLLSLGAPIGSQSLLIPDQTLSIFSTPIAASVTGSGFTVEIFTPDGTAAGNRFFIGSNNLGQSAPSYLRAPACGVTVPTSTAAIGFPGMNIVMNVRGTAGTAVPEPGTVAMLVGMGVSGIAVRRRKK